MGTSRRLAAIMFTDIVGYTAMMQQNEKKGIQSVRIHEDLLHRFVPIYEGEVLNLMGDGSLCIFTSSISAVKCARDIQRSLQEHDYVPLRIGIHLGEVTTEDTKAYGDGVNVASRIEGSGHAGIILFSKSVQSQIVNQPDLSYESVGMFQFKNVAKPMEIFALKDDLLAGVEPAKLKNKYSSRSKWKWHYAGIFGILIILFFTAFVKPGWLLNSSILIPVVKKDLIAVAVFPFKTSDHESIRDLEEWMMDLLHTKFISLEGMTSLDPIISKSLYEKNNGDIQKIMSLPGISQNDIDYAISGSVMNLGGVIKIIGNLVDKKGKPLQPVEVECLQIDQLNEKIEEFSRQLIARIMDRSKRDFTSLALTTTDFNTFIEYTHGEQSRRKGNFEKATGHFINAVEIDSTFALGWLKLLHNLLSYKPGHPWIMHSKKMLNRYTDQLPIQFQEYVKAYNLVVEGNFQLAISTLKNTLAVYGDNADVLFLLGDILFHTNVLYNRDMEEGMQYFDRIFEHSDYYEEAEWHAVWIALYKNDREYLQYFLNKYPNFMGGIINVELSIYQKYLDGYLNKESIDSIKPLVTENGNQAMSSIIALNKLDIALDLFNGFLDEMRLTEDSINIQSVELEHIFLIIQGKYAAAYNKFPMLAQRSLLFYIGQYGKNFQPFAPEMVDSFLRSLETNESFNPKNNNHFTGRSICRLLINDWDAVERDIVELQQRRENANSKSNRSFVQYHLFRLKAYLAREKGNYEKAHAYLDTLYNQPVYWDRYDWLYSTFYTGLKFMEAEMFFEEGNLSMALKLFQKMDKSGYFVTPLIYHAPIKYRLAYIYDLTGDKEKAYELFKYFVAIYGECDDFYQENVEYARNKIAAYEKGI